MSFGSTIRKLRKQHSLTQDQLANYLNVTPQAVSRWETNAAMPDISLLVPLANIFGVSTDVLLEVDVQKNAEHIEDFCTHYIMFREPYGRDMKEKLAVYREEVRRFPDSAELKEALISVLYLECEKQGAYPEPALYREMASLTEDIIALGGGANGLSFHQHQLVYYSDKLGNRARAAEIAQTAPEMDASREVLLPASLTGRAQIDARKDLIFKCTDTIIRTVYSMYAENADELSETEWEALKGAEQVVEAVYGKAFSDHFVLARHMYCAVVGELKRGNSTEAVQQLQRVVEKLEALEMVSATSSPLVTDEQFDELCITLRASYPIRLEARMLLKRVIRDFNAEEVCVTVKDDSRYREVVKRLDRLMDSDGGKVVEDCCAALERIRQAEGNA